MRPKNLPSLSLGLLLAGLFSVLCISRADAQIKIGTNGSTISPSSLLELESANQGLLLPRMADTVAINALNPPNGMLIYLTKAPAVGLYVRKVTGWEFLTGSLGGNGNFNSLTVAGTITAGNFSGPLTGNATTATTALNSTNSANSAVTNDISNPGITYPVFVNSTPGNQPLRTSSGNLSYIPATGILTARGFNGPLVGDVTGNATSAVDATNTVNLRITDDLTTPTTMYPTFVTGTAGPLPARVSSSRLGFVPLTGELTASTFRGALLGNASSATTVTGNVAAVNGGTGQSIYSPGDILYASASTTLSKLPIGVAGTVLRVGAGNLPTWSTGGAGTVINVSGAANRISVTDPTVSPIVDIAATYAGQTSITTLGTVATGVWNGTAVDVAHGGTGQTIIPPGVLIGNGTAPVTSLTGTAGYVLTSTGPTTAPVYSAVAGGDMILSAAQTITGNKTFSDGTLILRGSSGGSTTLVPNASSSATVTLPIDGIIVNRDGVEVLRNKTILSPVLTGTPNLGTSTGTSLNISGNVNASTFTGNLTGNVAGNATTATRFTDPLAGDVTGIQGNTVVAQVGGQNAALIAQSAVTVGSATQANNPNTLVLRNINGDFSAGTISANLVGTVTGNLIGNASTASTVATNANLTGPITSTGNATAIASQTGTGTTFAMSVSPAFTGTPSTPTAATATNNTQIASTAFVHAVVGMLKFSNVPATTSTPITQGTDAEVSYPAAGALITGTAVVSPVGALALGLGIASARISAANIVTVKYVNYSTAGTLTPNINLNITVIQ